MQLEDFVGFCLWWWWYFLLVCVEIYSKIPRQLIKIISFIPTKIHNRRSFYALSRLLKMSTITNLWELYLFLYLFPMARKKFNLALLFLSLTCPEIQGEIPVTSPTWNDWYIYALISSVWHFLRAYLQYI